MGFAHRAFVAAGVGFAVSVIAGCGSSGGRLLSASESNTLSEQLNRVTQALDSQQCSEAQQYLSQFQSTVANLGNVNSTLISNLDQGASTIQSLASSQCATHTVTVPKKRHPKTSTSTSTTTTATRTTPTFTTPTTTYTQPTYTQPTYTQPSTNTTGGTYPGSGTTTSGTTSTSTTSSTTTPSGGTGLGGTDTSASGTATSSTGSGGGF